jgi:Fe-Mn family superoxide dismutase
MASEAKDKQRTQSGAAQEPKSGQQLQGTAAGGRRHELPPLPYALDALQPHMSAETLQFHHGKHHRAYVDKLNELIPGTEFADMELEDIIRKAKGPIFNQAAQIWNHSFFWQCLSPQGGGNPKGQIARDIDSSFGSFDAFKDEFTKAAVGHFASGWAWLTRDGSGKLRIETLPNAETPVMRNDKAVITCDLWEHAYYIDYRNSRPEFMKAFWNLVNWEYAESTVR